MENDILQHWGIKGMHWGIRRFQNKDGSLTPAGKKRYGDDDDGKSRKDPPKNPKKMTTVELADAINHLRLEQTYNNLQAELNPKHASKGKQFVSNIWSKTVMPAMTEAGKGLLKDWMTKAGKEYLGLNAKEVKDLEAELDKAAKAIKRDRDNAQNKYYEAKYKKELDDLINPKTDDTPKQTESKSKKENEGSKPKGPDKPDTPMSTDKPKDPDPTPSPSSTTTYELGVRKANLLLGYDKDREYVKPEDTKVVDNESTIYVTPYGSAMTTKPQTRRYSDNEVIDVEWKETTQRYEATGREFLENLFK